MRGVRVSMCPVEYSHIIVRQAQGIGWGYYDTIAETLKEAFPQ